MVILSILAISLYQSVSMYIWLIHWIFSLRKWNNSLIKYPIALEVAYYIQIQRRCLMHEVYLLMWIKNNSHNWDLQPNANWELILMTTTSRSAFGQDVHLDTNISPLDIHILWSFWCLINLWSAFLKFTQRKMLLMRRLFSFNPVVSKITSFVVLLLKMMILKWDFKLFLSTCILHVHWICTKSRIFFTMGWPKIEIIILIAVLKVIINRIFCLSVLSHFLKVENYRQVSKISKHQLK